MDTALPAADPASPWMKHLERAHGKAHAAARAIGEESEPSLHLAPAARRLELGIAAMYDAFDGRADRPTALNLAHGRLWDAAILVARAGLPGALAALREACAELVSAEARFPLVTLAAPTMAPLRAAIEALPLHAIARASLTPTFRAPPLAEPEAEVPAVVLPEPTTFAELAAAAEAARGVAAAQRKAHQERAALPAAKTPAEAPIEAEAPPGFAFAPPPALGEDDFVRRWARECFDEIGMIGVQRAPLPGDEWRMSLPLERRLLTAVDAIAALGPTAIAHLEPLALDVPVANPMSVFAIATMGGSLEGRDALACAERVLHHFGPNDPTVAEPFVAAMKLAPNPFVPGVLRALLAATERGCRAVAVEVLAYRGWLLPDELAALAEEEDPRVFALALPALAAARHRDLGRALARALPHADPRVQAAALDAMALAAHPQAAGAARVAAAGALGDRALIHVAIAASEEDARWLLARLNASPTVAAIEAVGWAGLVDAVPALLRALEEDDEPVKLAAGAALDRLLGASLIDRIEILPEALADVEIVDPDPDPDADRPARPTLVELMLHPRDQPSAGSSETLEVPSIDPARWRAHWAEHAHRHDPKQRLRRGNPYSPSMSLYELDRLPLSVDDRRRLHRELAARTGKLTHFDPHDFVLAQEQSLAAWGALVRATVETPGSWGRPAAR
jgi:hypothetical protein